MLRRILRRAVRHAWLLGRREPTLVDVVDAVVDSMGDVYPELRERREHLLRITRTEEERFLPTIEGGMERFEELAAGEGGTIPGDEAFKLYDTFGFPLDLTQLMAEERGYDVDVDGFDVALDAQRARSRADRASSGATVEGSEDEGGWTVLSDAPQTFVGYDRLTSETRVLALRSEGGTAGLVLEENPFYLESGGQVSDHGRVWGDGWSVDVERVAAVGGRTAVFGPVTGAIPADGEALPAKAEVPSGVRHDTVRNHTATHLLHAALREVLGDHVVQRGSLVAPDRLRFDFSHTAPMTLEERRRVEEIVNRRVWEDHPVTIDQKSYPEAVAAGAMALFGEKYGDRVRVVDIPGVSMELCGGTHVRHTGEIGLFRIVGESGVAAGVRRVEALTGPGAFRYLTDREKALEEAAEVLRTQPDNLTQRAQRLLAEKAELEALLAEVRSGGGAGETEVVREAFSLPNGTNTSYRALRLRARDADDARSWGDAFLQAGESGAAVVVADLPEDRQALFAFVTDDLISRGVRADALVREVSAVVGGKGGGRPHLAQGGVTDASKLDQALERGAEKVREWLLGSAVG